MMTLRDVSLSYGSLVLFDGFDFFAGVSDISCILGPSGCGKTSILNMFAGIVLPDSGEVIVPDRISYVFQESRLLPWATIEENAGYAIDSRMPAGERKDRLGAMLELMELTDAAAKRPSEVSGGMARRCALARALLAGSDGMLMDEPLSSLDPDLRSRILERLPELLRGKTVILVTHDYGVASVLSDRIFKLSDPPVKISEVANTELELIIRQIEEKEQAQQG